MGSPKSIGERVKVMVGVKAKTRAAGTSDGPVIDRKDFQSCVLYAEIGDVGGTPSAQTLDAKILEADASSGPFTDLAGAAITQVTAADASAQINLDLSTAKQFILTRLVVGFTGGTSPTMGTQATLVLGGAATFPV